MEKIYLCPKCNKARNLIECDCNYQIRSEKSIYDFLEKNYRSQFDEIASHYYDDSSPEIQIEIARSINKIKHDGIVLDLGSGSGEFSLPLLKYKYEVICIDSSLVMLDKLVKKQESNFDNLRVLHADANKIPLLDSSVDIVIANNLFHLLANPEVVLKEIYRVLKVGGSLIQISDSQNSEYQEFGNMDEYYAIVNLYNNNYLNIIKDLNYNPIKFNTKFNLRLEAMKLFKEYFSITTNPIYYEGSKTIKDFLIKQAAKSDYAKLNIPFEIHDEAHKKCIQVLNEKFANGYEKVEIKYKGMNLNIIDAYIK